MHASVGRRQVVYSIPSKLQGHKGEHSDGQRYNFIFWDELLKSPIVNEIIKPCATLSPGVMLSLHFREKCNYCICKTCAIAEINGGAPGCGNCKDCDLIDGCRSCNEYYNPEPIRRNKNDNRN